jgi:hypothetical protein
MHTHPARREGWPATSWSSHCCDLHRRRRLLLHRRCRRRIARLRCRPSRHRDQSSPSLGVLQAPVQMAGQVASLGLWFHRHHHHLHVKGAVAHESKTTIVRFVDRGRLVQRNRGIQRWAAVCVGGGGGGCLHNTMTNARLERRRTQTKKNTDTVGDIVRLKSV